MATAAAQSKSRPSVEVRLARDEDMIGLLTLLKRAGEQEHPQIPLDPVRAHENIQAVMDQGIVLVALEGGTVVGSHGMMPHQWWFSDAWHLHTYWLYVDPDARRHAVGIALIRNARTLANRVRLPLIVQQYSASDVERTEGFLGRYMTRIGGLFVYGEQYMEGEDVSA